MDEDWFQQKQINSRGKICQQSLLKLEPIAMIRNSGTIGNVMLLSTDKLDVATALSLDFLLRFLDGSKIEENDRRLIKFHAAIGAKG
jgi:hypothetical protein